MNKDDTKFLVECIAQAVWDEDWEALEQHHRDAVYVKPLDLFWVIVNGVQELIDNRYYSHRFVQTLDRIHGAIDTYYE